MPAWRGRVRPTRIAFVCTGNTGRSVAAVAIAEALIARDRLAIVVIGRGVDVNPAFVQAEAPMATMLVAQGIDVSGHRATPLCAGDVRHADLIVAMTAKHRDTIVAQYPDAKAKIFTMTEYATGQDADIIDAHGKDMAVYKQVFGQISALMPAVLRKASQK